VSKIRSTPPTTAPPPFDPEEYARSSESTLEIASDFKLTAELPTPPPLNKRVRLAVPPSDIAWFDLSPEAMLLCDHLDGTRTLLELLERPGPEPRPTLVTVSELHEARLLAFED
jgi:hypothetical protein